jgi:putative ABC transport system ATP-binding protein
LAILKVENLSKIYSKKGVSVQALNNVSFDINEGEFVSILGRSGSGKSTLLNMIGGLDTPTQGKILFNGNALHQMNKKALEEHRLRSVGMIFQSFNLISHRTALDNVALPLIFGGLGKKERIQRSKDLLSQVGLAGRMHHVPAELSGGETQRVAIARALANNPTMLLADEPTGNLDSRTSEEILQAIMNLHKSGMSILMITHEKEIAYRASDRVITLLDGEIISIEDGSKANESETSR